MSSSENVRQSGMESRSNGVFRLEPFDKPGPASSLKTGEQTFEAFFADDGQKTAFRSMLFSETEKAEDIIEEAKKRAVLIESEAYEKGFAQGEKDGFEVGTKKLDKILDRIEGTLGDMVSYRQRVVRLYEKEILHLISRIAEKVARTKVKIDSSLVRETIFEAFNFVIKGSEVTVRVNPEDIEYVKGIRPEFFDRISNLKSVVIVSDPSISQGGCFLETTFGNVDARLETQFDKIGKALEQAFDDR